MSTATDMLASYIAAEKAILEGKQVSFQGRNMGMEDLDKVIAGRREWEERVNREARLATGRPSLGGASFSVARFGG